MGHMGPMRPEGLSAPTGYAHSVATREAVLKKCPVRIAPRDREVGDAFRAIFFRHQPRAKALGACRICDGVKGRFQLQSKAGWPSGQAPKIPLRG